MQDDEILRLLCVASDTLSDALPSKVTKRSSSRKKDLVEVVEVDWKFLCHLVQAHVSYLSIVIGKMKSKGTYDECFLSQLCGITSKLLTTSLLDQLRAHLASDSSHGKLIQSMITSSLCIANTLANLIKRRCTFDLVDSCFRALRHDCSIQISCVVDAVRNNPIDICVTSNEV